MTDPADPAAPGVPAPAEPVATGAERATRSKDAKSEGSFLKELPILLAVALVLAMLIKAFVVQAFFIPSGSMEQTLHGCAGCQGDRVLVNKFVYRFRDIHRGEIVVFNGLDSFQAETVVPPPRNGFERFQRAVAGALGLGQPGETDYIKRVIGLPGDSVACCTHDHVTVNGVELDEPYVYQDDHQQFGPIVVPKGKLFVMGDHRSHSSDSRACRCAVPIDKVAGRAFVVIWPKGRWKGLRVPGAIEHAGIPKGTAALAVAPWTYAATPPGLGLLLACPVVGLRRRVRRRRG